MDFRYKSFPISLIAGCVIAIATFACATLLPAATATPTGQIGAIETGTPGLNGDKKDYQVWTGTITSQTSRQYMSNGSVVNNCITDWLTDLYLSVDSTGNVAGTGRAALSAPRTCSPQSNLVANTSEMTIRLTGRKDSSAFYLNFSPTVIIPSASADFGGYMLLVSDGTCPGNKPDIQIPSTGSSAAAAQLDLSGVMTGCGGSKDDLMTNKSAVTLQFRFRCSDLPSDTTDPALRQLCE